MACAIFGPMLGLSTYSNRMEVQCSTIISKWQAEDALQANMAHPTNKNYYQSTTEPDLLISEAGNTKNGKSLGKILRSQDAACLLNRPLEHSSLYLA